ncbi:uncharacterized protein LOC116350247 [Contarinia nasturtii]|uniref:uncharacterized protein LOC116350247 n=1 Tax=Contarinia nasturtii TaxID=265458 RepID=UPI0012D3C625|nr:uncharacterized protein LOC116350247 [Contarinia nasturtii]
MDKRKVNRQWQKSEVRTLIEQLEAQPDLWDPSRPNYQNRNIKQKLLQEMAISLNVTSQEISSKLHSLRTQFNRECSREKKQKSGSGGDEIYISKWEYMSSLHFLKVGSVSGETFSNLNTHTLKSNDLPCLLNELETRDLIVVSTDSSDTQSEYGERSSNQKITHSQTTNQRTAKRKYYEDKENLLMERAIAVMDQRSDEWDIFGQFVASELRQIFDPIKKNTVKRLIMNTLMSQGIFEQTENGFTAETRYMVVSDDDIQKSNSSL